MCDCDVCRGGAERGGNFYMPFVALNLKFNFLCGNVFLMDKTEIFVVFNSKVIRGRIIFIFKGKLGGQKGFWFSS